MSPLYYPIRLRFALAALCLFGGAAGAAELQHAPAPIVVAQSDPDAPADDPQGASAFLVRITRLEDQLRQMTGQIEQLQFQNKRLEDQLRKMQQDVDFRFQDLGRAQPGTGRPAAQKRGDLGPADAPASTASIAPPTGEVDNPPPSAAIVPRPARKTSDAFDPNADPSAPGAPKPIGTTPPSDPLPPRTAVTVRPAAPSVPMTLADAAPHAPMDLMPNTVIRPTDPAAVEPIAPRLASTGPDVTPPAPVGTRAEYDADLALYRSSQFDAAANGFQAFLQKYPKDRLTPEATYLLGESFARLGRHREAAEQFLKVSTDYTRSTRAPDALLRLGVALNNLGAKEQACATYQEVDRKYPTASPDVRANVDRELKRAKC